MNEPTWKDLIDSQEKVIASLRAENERLKDQAKEITAASENDGVNWYDLGYQHGAVSTLNDDLVKEIDEKTLETQVANTSIDLLNSELEILRKRCEDLEALIVSHLTAHQSKLPHREFTDIAATLGLYPEKRNF